MSRQKGVFGTPSFKVIQCPIVNHGNINMVTSWRSESRSISLVVLNKLTFVISKPFYQIIRKVLQTDVQAEGHRNG